MDLPKNTIDQIKSLIEVLKFDELKEVKKLIETKIQLRIERVAHGIN